MDETVYRIESPNAQFKAELSINRGSALKPDWYAVSVGKVHAGWLAVLSRDRNHTMCTLQGPGTAERKMGRVESVVSDLHFVPTRGRIHL